MDFTFYLQFLTVKYFMDKKRDVLNVDIVNLYISPGHNYFGHHGKPADKHEIIDCDLIEIEAGKGVIGDRFFDFKENYKGQVTFFEQETFEQLARDLKIKGKTTAAFRRNIITQGIDLNTLIGREFEVQGVLFLGTEEAKPCYWMNESFGPGAEEALKGKGGLRAKALTSGTIRRQK